MSISNELSSDITRALVDTLKEKGSTGPEHVVEIVRNVHSALEPLEKESHTRRMARAVTTTGHARKSGA